MEILGIVRRIDDLGRIIIPRDLRKICDLKEGDALEIFIDKDKNIIMKKHVENPERIYIVESKDHGCPKIELLSIVSISSNAVKVRSIYDGYEYEYEKEYFMKISRPATQKDIDNYKFSLNK